MWLTERLPKVNFITHWNDHYLAWIVFKGRLLSPTRWWDLQTEVSVICSLTHFGVSPLSDLVDRIAPSILTLDFSLLVGLLQIVSIGYIERSRAMRDAERSEASRIARLSDRNIGYSLLYAPPCSTERTAFEKVVHLSVCTFYHIWYVIPYMIK